MSAEERNKLDDIFKQGLGEPDTFAEYHDQDWDDLEQLLDAGKPTRGIIYWMRPVITGMAALLLLALGIWFFKPTDKNGTNNTTSVKHNDSNNIAIVKPGTVNPPQTINLPSSQTGTTDNTASGKEGSEPATTKAEIKHTATTSGTAQYASTLGKSDLRSGKNNGVKKFDALPITEKQNVQPVINQTQQNVIANNTNVKPPVTTTNTINGNTDPVNANTTVTGGENAAVKGNTGQIASTNTNKPDVGVDTNPSIVPAVKVKKNNPSGFKPQIGVAMLLAPDVNGAGSFQNARVGTNIGLLISVGVTKKLTISTGAGYSKKPYEVGFADYHVGYKFKTDPEQVYADCRVLDIPINVDYKLYNRNHNAFSVGTGLSSYIMLRETYNYNYADPATTGPASFTVVNRNRHILGVLNLNATYEHQLNNKFSIAAQPYLKIPLTDIGNSQVRLQSAGLALGVKWNINH